MEPIKYPNRAKQLRERLLSQPMPALKPIEIDGETFHIRAPVLSNRDDIVRLAMPRKAKKKGGAARAGLEEETDLAEDLKSVPMDRMQAAAAIVLACDEVGTAIFGEEDFDTIRGAAVGSWIETLATAALAALNPEKEIEKSGEA